jgi:hypothetical protein
MNKNVYKRKSMPVHKAPHLLNSSPFKILTDAMKQGGTKEHYDNALNLIYSSSKYGMSDNMSNDMSNDKSKDKSGGNYKEDKKNFDNNFEKKYRDRFGSDEMDEEEESGDSMSDEEEEEKYKRGMEGGNRSLYFR